MKFIQSLFLVVLFFPLMFSSCTPEASSESCKSFTGTPTESVTGPTSTTVGVPVNLNVVFFVYNTCGFFDQFFEEEIEGIKYVTVNAVYDGCVCEEITLLKSATYSFVSQTAGTYTLRFKISNTTYVEHTIEVTN